MKKFTRVSTFSAKIVKNNEKIAEMKEAIAVLEKQNAYFAKIEAERKSSNYAWFAVATIFGLFTIFTLIIG